MSRKRPSAKRLNGNSAGKTRKHDSQASARTAMVHGQPVTEAWNFSRHLIPPITANTTFRLDSLARGAQGFLAFASDEETPEEQRILIYDRLDEPNTMMLEEQLASMEKAGCAVTFGSGMGAISATLLSLLSAGQNIVAHRTLYGCTYSLLTGWMPRFGVGTKLIDVNSEQERKIAIDSKTRVVYFETVSNPNLDLADVPAIVKDIQRINSTRKESDKIITVVDNTFATPWGFRPLDWGIDVVIHSLTKNISGFGTEMGGAAMAAKRFERGLKVARKDFGAIMNPRSAWHITVHGIPTLAIRFAQQQTNAIAVAKFLSKHRKVETVTYPGLPSFPQHKLAKKLLRTPEGDFAPGTMISFTVKGGLRKCEKFVDLIAKNSYSITLAVSLGLTKTLIEVPGFMTHSAIPADKQGSSGIDPNAIRLSLGVENSTDIIADLEQALSKI